MLADAHASLRDPNRLALDDALALVDARLAELVRDLDQGESGQRWRRLREAWHVVSLAQRQGDAAALRDGVRQIDAVLAGVAPDDTAIWREIDALVERRRKLVESERRRLVEARLVISVEEAATMADAFVDVVLRHVDDPRVNMAIAEDFRRLLGPVDPAIPGHIDC